MLSAAERLVRLFLGNMGTKEAMLHAIDQVAWTARAALRSWIDVAGPYGEGRGRFPYRLHVNALVMRLVFEISVVELTWAEWARAEVERWPDATTPADRQALERLIAGLLAQIPPPVAGDVPRPTR
jgi:hypothetical protein